MRWFAYRIASHAATDWVRGRRVLKRSRVRGDVPLNAAARDGDPARALSRRQLTELLGRALPRAQLEAFLLRAAYGCTVEEVASLSGVPPNTVRSRLRRARRALRERLDRDPELLSLLEAMP